MNIDVRVEDLSDQELLRRTGELAARGRRIEAALIAPMAEVDHRKLYRGEACSSMFAYATGQLRLSESQAYDRITVARTSLAFPLVLEMLADGRLTPDRGVQAGPSPDGGERNGTPRAGGPCHPARGGVAGGRERRCS